MSEENARVHPLEGKAWFRLIKVFYVGLWVFGAGISVLIGTIEESVEAFLIAGLIVATLMIVSKKAFYYILLGRTTPFEPAGTGFADIDDLRRDFASTKAKAPELHKEVIEPYLEAWEAQYGRRIPKSALAEMQERTALELEQLQEKRKEMISNAGREGVTVEFEKIREHIEAAKAAGRGDEDWIRHVEELQAKYGSKIPIDALDKVLQELEESIKAQEAAEQASDQ